MCASHLKWLTLIVHQIRWYKQYGSRSSSDSMSLAVVQQHLQDTLTSMAYLLCKPICLAILTAFPNQNLEFFVKSREF